MRFYFIPYLWMSAFLSFICSMMAVYAYKRRKAAGAQYFFTAMILIIIWIITQALEFASKELDIKIFFADIQYVSIMFLPVMILKLISKFTGQGSFFFKKSINFILYLVPVVFLVLLWTNSTHELMRREIFLNDEAIFPVVGKTFGPLFWPFVPYNFLISIIPLVLLIKAMGKDTMLLKEQISCLFTGITLPIISTFLNITGIIRLGFDLTPLIIGISILIISFGIFYHNLFDIMPIAHSKIIENMDVGVVVLDRADSVLEINKKACELFSYSSCSEIFGVDAKKVFCDHPAFTDFIINAESASREIRFNNDDTEMFFEVTVASVDNKSGRLLGRMFLFYDITERKNASEIISHAAHHDKLTELPNRFYFYKIFENELKQAKMINILLGVAFVDLDNFKQINDRYGHEAGDHVLCETANRLRSGIRDTDIAARIGGDEFMILLTGIRKYENIELVNTKICGNFSTPVIFNGDEIAIKASIGVAVYPRDGEDTGTLVKNADAAMYSMKRKSKSIC